MRSMMVSYEMVDEINDGKLWDEMVDDEINDGKLWDGRWWDQWW